MDVLEKNLEIGKSLPFKRKDLIICDISMLKNDINANIYSVVQL